MKILFASDIHGSLYYTNLLLAKFIEEKADKLVLLGDLLYHGPRNPLTKDYNPLEVSNLLNKYSEKIIAVRGNCDSEVDQMILNFPIMSDYLQIFIDNHQFFITHGHLYDLNNLPIFNDNTIFTFGHIHIPILERHDNIFLLNPSSISLPKDNNPHTYAIYENNMLVIKSFANEIINSISL